MKITIIGANSYIARNLIYVLKENYKSVQLRLYDYSEKQLDGHLEYDSINILEQKSVSTIDLDSDLIYFFVGKTGSINGFTEYEEFIKINEIGLMNVLREYVAQKSKAKFIFPSTRLVYKGRKGILKESAEKEFKTIYAMNKYACENYLKQYNDVFGLKYCILRICVPYGTMIKNASSYGTAEFMIKKAEKGENITLYGNGNVRRTITYMGDLCNVLVKAGLNDNCINDIYNVGGEDYSLKEMANLIAKKYQVEVEYLEWPEIALKIESGDTVFDSSKIEKFLQERPQKKFAEWIKKI